MKRTSNSFRGMRAPTKQEQAWIFEQWCPEAKRSYSPNAGKLIRYIGVLWICTGTVSAIRNEDGIAHMILLLIAGIICFAISLAGRKSSHRRRRRIEALTNGDYLVSSAMSARVWSGYTGNNHNGYVDVVASDNGNAVGSYKIPYVCAAPLLEKKIHKIPVLLIHIA